VGVRGGAVGSVVEVLDPEEMEGDLISLCSLARDPVHALIADLTFPTQDKHADVRMYPLIPTDSGHLLFAPHLFLTANWETLLLRMWARDYPAVYGKSVASRKRQLARDLAGLLEKKDWLVASNRPLRDSSRRHIGDVDVGVFAPNENFLALFEVKWLIPPDDVHEVVRADEEIAKGMTQVTTARDFASRYPGEFFAQVFPRHPPPARPPDILAFVMSQGDIGTDYIARPDVPVLDFELSEALLRRHTEPSLREVCRGMASLLDLPMPGRDYVVIDGRFRLAGYDVSMPAFARPGYVPPTPGRPKAGRNDRCPCGSGRKYKRCCDL
jgi:hypothetical protein